MQTAPIKLPKLLSLIRNGKFEIPQFQRSFVWRENQVKLLIDSIARGYPVGSFLLMNKDENLDLKSRSIEALISDEEGTEEAEEALSGEAQYILDGQQRITSITRVFLNGNLSKAYYFDLNKVASESWDDETDWITSRAKNNKQARERISNNRLIRSDIVLDQEKSDIYISEYVEDGEDFDYLDKNQKRKTVAKIKGVFENIRNYDLSLITIDASQGLESICRVFETINSTGTRLTTFDLAVARFYPQPDLRNMWESSLEKFPILKDFGVEGERFLQVIYLLNAHSKNDSQPEPTRSSLLSLPKDVIQKEWERAALGLSEAYEWASNNGVRPETLAGEYSLVSLAAFLSIYGDIRNDISANFNSRLRQWFYSRVLNPGIRASNYVIGYDFANLRAYAENTADLDVKQVSINRDILLRLNRNDNRFKGIQCIMALSSHGDILTGKSLDGDIEYHHIFPRSMAKNGIISSQKIENVLNRMAVTKSTNRNLSDKAPEDYIAKLIKDAITHGTVGDVEDRLRGLLFPDDIASGDYITQFKEINFDLFLEKRADIVMGRVRAILGNNLNEEEKTDEESA